jgi:hypothetical protein
MTNTQPQAWTLRHGARLLIGSGIVGALLVSSCCILPVILFSLGVSGAWIGNFTQLAPYQPYFVAVALACLGAGYWPGATVRKGRLRRRRDVRAPAADSRRTVNTDRSSAAGPRRDRL